MENCKIVFVDEVFAVEKPGTQLNVHTLTAAAASSSNGSSDATPSLSELLH